jgi:hypothetical protein
MSLLLKQHSYSCRPFTAELQGFHSARKAYRSRPLQGKAGSPICRSSGEAASNGSSGNLQLKITSRKVLKQLSSLRLAIAELATIAGLSAIGTVVKQNESVEFYVQNFPGATATANLPVISMDMLMAAYKLTMGTTMLCLFLGQFLCTQSPDRLWGKSLQRVIC